MYRAVLQRNPIGSAWPHQPHARGEHPAKASRSRTPHTGARGGTREDHGYMLRPGRSAGLNQPHTQILARALVTNQTRTGARQEKGAQRVEAYV